MFKIASALILGIVITVFSIQRESGTEYPFIASSGPEVSEVHGEPVSLSVQSLREQNIYAPLEAKAVDDDYRLTGRIYLSDRRTAVSVKAASDTDIHIKGSITRVEGEMQLIYEDCDGNEIILAESEADSEQPIDVDTTLHVKAGTGDIYFSGASAVYDFDIRFGLQDDINYYLK